MNSQNNKNKGRIGLSMAINYFTLNNYTVSIPLNDTQWYDLIIEKNGIFQTVQCKCTSRNKIALRSTGGTKGIVYDNVKNHINLDILFCVDKDNNIFIIPFKDLYEAKNLNEITLKTTPFKYNQGFQTYKYLIK